MAFVKEFRDVKDAFPEWEYLNRIGVRNFRGRPLKKFAIELVVDRENDYYLVSQGHTGFNEYEDVHYYALCIKGKVINMETLIERSGSGANRDIEITYNVTKIIFPEGWSVQMLEGRSLFSIIEEAFIVKTYNKSLTKEKVKKLTVNIIANI